jgi:hypothetical protein
MPIKVTCACGQSFAANDALAGKRVKCPKCAQPLQIPGAVQAGGGQKAASPGAAPQAPRPQQQRPQQPAAPADPFGALFDEVGLKAQQVNSGPTCPNCRAAMAPGAILCVQCGYNQKLGRVMQTVTTSGAIAGMPAGGGHGHGGEVASKLMEQAARTIEEEAESERSKTSEGFPWYGYLGMLIGALAFMAAMRFIPHGNALQIAAAVGIFIGTMIQLYANIRILIVAFTEGIGHGIGCLLCGCYDLYYVITRWDVCAGYVGLWGIGWVVGFFAQLLSMFAASFAGGPAEGEDEVRLDQPPPAHVVVEASPVLSIPLLRNAS